MERHRMAGSVARMNIGVSQKATSWQDAHYPVDYGLEETKIVVWFSAKSRDFSLLHSEQTRYLLAGYEIFYTMVKRAECKGTPYSADFKNICISTVPPHAGPWRDA